MNFEEILKTPGFPVDEEAAENMRVILDCLESDYVKPGVSRIEGIRPIYDSKTVVIEYRTCFLSGDPQHDGKYLANLFRIPDAISIHPSADGDVIIRFSSVVWK